MRILVHTPGSKWAVFGICSGLFFLSMLYRASPAVIALDLGRDLQLSTDELGILGALYFYLSMLMQFPLGQLLDRVGAWRTMIILNVVGTTGAVIFSQASGLLSGLAGRGLLGLGMSVNMVGAMVLFTRWFGPAEFATVTGLYLAWGSLGSLMATSPLRLLSDAVGWRNAFFLLAAANILLTAALAIWVRESPLGKNFSQKVNGMAEQGLSVFQTLKLLFRDLNYWGISFASFAWYGVLAAIQNLWGGPFLMVHLGLPKMMATYILFAAGIGGMIGTPLGGLLSDRVFKSRKKAVLLCLSVMAGAVLCMAHWPGSNLLIPLAGLFFCFGCSAGFGAILYTHIKELMPDHMSGTAVTGINFFISLGAAVFLHGFGRVVGRGANESLTGGGDYYTAFMICFWALAAALFVYMFTRDISVKS